MSKLKQMSVVLATLVGLTSGYAAAMLPGDGAAFRTCLGHVLYAVYDEGWGYKYVSLKASC